MRILAAILVVFAALPVFAGTIQCSNEAAALDIVFDRFLSKIDAAAREFDFLKLEDAASLRTATAELAWHLDLMATSDKLDLCRQIANNPDLAAIPDRLTNIAATASTGARAQAGSCPSLNDAAWQELFTTTQALELSAILAGGFCGATECISLVCVGPCIFAGIAQAAAVVSSAILDRADYCGTIEFAGALTDFAADTADNLTSIEAVLELVEPRADIGLSSRVSEEMLQRLSEKSADEFSALEGLADQLELIAANQAVDEKYAGENAVHDLIETSLLGVEGPIISLVLPSSAGGLLEIVRERVAETIVAYQDLGIDIQNALILFTQGDAELNRQRYKAAYNSYRTAYRDLAGGSL